MDLNQILKDPTAVLLILSNLAVIVFAVLQNWSLLTLLWVYWAQSIIIGFFQFFKILLSWNSFAEKLEKFFGKANSSFSALSALGTVFIACFFAVHYGLFHWGYAMFLSAFPQLFQQSAANFNEVLLAAGIFFVNHLFSFIYYIAKPPKKKKSPNELMGEPYARILPMHLTIMFLVFALVIFGNSGIVLALVFFLLLKTLADVSMHIREHADQQKSGI